MYNVQVRRRITLEVARPGALFAGIFTSVILLDQAVKAAVRATLEPGDSVALIDGILHLTYVRNTGAAFGLMPGQRALFMSTGLIVALGVLVYMLWARPRAGWLVSAIALIGAGAVGNLIDRSFVGGKVTDFIDVFGDVFPVFNVADSAIVVGVIMLVLWVLLVPDPEDAPGAQELPVQESGQPHVEPHDAQEPDSGETAAL